MTETKLPVNATLEQAKQVLRDGWVEGVECPCCTQLVRQWRHSLNSAIARTLIRMRTISVNEGREYVHIMNEIHITTMYAIAEFWGLIEPAVYPTDVQKTEDKKASGQWKLTELGIKFVENEETIQKYAHVFNGKVYKFSGDPVSIIDCLGKKFSYNELKGR